MTYAVKEIFYTLQGEGVHTGRPAVFCRFAGCNLWSGREEDRAEAVCRFCDTDFVGVDGTDGGKYPSAGTLAEKVKSFWPKDQTTKPFVVFTGGEPLLQLNEELINAMHDKGFEIAIETNGTLPAPPGIDWICVSPKGNAPLSLTCGNELKLVIPQDGMDPKKFEALEFECFSVQPMDGPESGKNTAAAIAFCMENPRWRLSLQTHKMMGIR